MQGGAGVAPLAAPHPSDDEHHGRDPPRPACAGPPLHMYKGVLHPREPQTHSLGAQLHENQIEPHTAHGHALSREPNGHEPVGMDYYIGLAPYDTVSTHGMVTVGSMCTAHVGSQSQRQLGRQRERRDWHRGVRRPPRQMEGVAAGTLGVPQAGLCVSTSLTLHASMLMTPQTAAAQSTGRWHDAPATDASASLARHVSTPR